MNPPTLFDVKFQALRNALYHKARQRRLDGWARAANLVTILLGSAAAAKAFGLGPAISEVVIGFFVAAVGAFQLVYDWSGRARTHDFLQRRYYEVLAKIEESSNDPDPLFPVKMSAELMRIYADEPPTLRALDSIAYNEALDGVGSDKMDRLVISPWQSLWKHTYAFAEAHFETYRERQNRLAQLEKTHG